MSFIKSNCKIVLASTSKIRADIMKDSGLQFDTGSPDFNEELFKDQNPHLNIKDLAIELAKGKALNVQNSAKDEVIIGCDQICEIEGDRIDKSNDEGDALNQLLKLSGKTHFQNNAVVITLNDEVIFENFTRVELKMHDFTKEQLTNYVKNDKPIGCAGSYKYESLGKILFEKVNGDHFSILGMNIQQVMSFLLRRNFIEI